MSVGKTPVWPIFASLALILAWLSLAIGCGGSGGQVASVGSPAARRSASEKAVPGAARVQEKLGPNARTTGQKTAEATVRQLGRGEDLSAEASQDHLAAARRPWRAADGTVLAIGEFVDLIDNHVCIETADGLGAKIPLVQLCPEDQEFVRSQLAGKEETTASSAREGSESLPDELVADEEVIVDQIASGQEAPPGAGPSGATTAGGQVDDPRKFVIPFDFVSQFDDGRYGQMVAEMFWKKLQREGGFLLPESMLEVRDFCAANHIRITPETPLEEVGRVVRELFGGHIAIWGSVERAPGAMWDVYDLVIKCVDFSGDRPQVIFDLVARTNTVSEIPHLYGEQLLDKLYARQPRGPRPADPLAEENWQKNPNLVVGGDFEQGSGGVPIGWEKGGGQHREPLGRLVKWIPEPGNPSNRIIRFEFGADVGDTYGVMYYSEPFPVEEGATYRFQCRWRSSGPAVKVFIKCYDLFESEYQPAAALAAAKSRQGSSYLPSEKQLREVYRSQQNLKGPLNQWNVHTEDFTPRHTKYTPRWGKVMLYAYLGAGVVDFDDIVVKQILPPSPGEKQKELRHSLASPVTVKEMEENIRRGQEAGQRRQASEPK